MLKTDIVLEWVWYLKKTRGDLPVYKFLKKYISNIHYFQITFIFKIKKPLVR